MCDYRVVLCGFMGTGKSTVGRRLAERLGGRFVDLDDVIEQRFGMPVRAVFERHGEEAFRGAERDACARAGALGAVVIAAGGGAVLNPANREALAAFGTLVCLDASIAELQRRLKSTSSRPMLQGHEPLGTRIRTLLEQRREAYDTIAWHVDTTGRSVDEVVRTIETSLAMVQVVGGMRRLAVNTTERRYDVCIATGALDALGAIVRDEVRDAEIAAVVTNTVVGPLYAERAAASLHSTGYETHTITLPDGEQHKRQETIAQLYGQFVAAGLDRQSVVVALGGGVVGDMAGFAAATYLRGIRVVQVPTSLLAMVDASVGGKTGVDLPEGKNLVGAFKQPEVVVTDPGVLGTLPAVELQCGKAELIKHAVLDAPGLFGRLAGGETRLDDALLAEAIRVKVDVVNEDPLEKGRRAVLNLGHTFAHGFERASGFAIPHGLAVGVGLRASARLGRELGLCDSELEEGIAGVLGRHGLPLFFAGLSSADVRAAMSTDKKRLGRKLRFVVPRAIGWVEVVEAPPETAVESAIRAVVG